MDKTDWEPSTMTGLRCLGFLAFVVFALLVTAAIILGIEGASAGVIIALSIGALFMCAMTGCLCIYLPANDRAGMLNTE